MEKLTVQDQVFQLREGWFCVVANRIHGTWADRGAALAGLATEQRRELARQGRLGKVFQPQQTSQVPADAPVSLGEFWDRLKAHDWWYMMSDDNRVYRRGRAAEMELERLAAMSERHRMLMQSYRRFVNGEISEPGRPE